MSSNELDQVRAFRAGDGAPDADARAAARMALLRRIEAAASPAPLPLRIRRPRRRRFALGLGASAATAAALALALVWGLGSGGVQPTEATAAQLLRRAADVAAEGPDVVLRPGQYWYTRSESLSRTTRFDKRSYAYLRHMRREAWIGRDGGGRVRQYAVGRPRFPHPRDRAAWIASGRPVVGPAGVMDVPLLEEDGTIPRDIYNVGDLRLSYEEMRALPTDADELYALVAREAREKHNALGAPRQMFTIVGDLLREAPLPPALRAALYRAVARIPSVRLAGRATDAAGRVGVAVTLAGGRERTELVFDARTARLLGERQERDGAPVFVTAYLESGVTDTVRERP